MTSFRRRLSIRESQMVTTSFPNELFLSHCEDGLRFYCVPSIRCEKHTPHLFQSRHDLRKRFQCVVDMVKHGIDVPFATQEFGNTANSKQTA